MTPGSVPPTARGSAPATAASGFVMRIIHATGTVTRPAARARVGQYVASYNPEAHDGRGDVTTSTDIARARVFVTQAEAIEAWRAVPTCRPLRADGQPNRPLTAFTVEVLPVLRCQFCGDLELEGRCLCGADEDGP